MSDESAWDTVREAAGDQESGAAEIARRAAEALAALPDADIEDAVLTLVRGHPSMAPLWRLGTEVLRAEDPGARIMAARTFAAGLTREREGVAFKGAVALSGGEALVHSYSSTVAAAVIEAGVSALCALSEPGGEGAAMALRLEDAGIRATVVSDEEALEAAATRTVVVGADAVGPGGVVNKVRTRALAEAARAGGQRCYALAGSSKLVASDLPAPDPFERVPLDLFTAIVQEDGTFSPSRVAAFVGDYRLDPRLEALLRT